MKLENTEVWGFEHAIRGARNPLESWHKSDSVFDLTKCNMQGLASCDRSCAINKFCIGKNDIDLLKRLTLAGTDHRKFMRQIMVSVDITAPLYWYKEYDTYKVGTTANSTSTMHRLATTPITINCFEHDKNVEVDNRTSTDLMFANVINDCEKLRQLYLETKDKKYWRALIQLLPNSWLQTRTVTMNYENLRNMYFARRNHKLSEWHVFCDWIKHLPYGNELICLERKNQDESTEG